MYVSASKIEFKQDKTNSTTNQMRRRLSPEPRIKGPDEALRNLWNSGQQVNGFAQNFKTGQSVEFASHKEQLALQYLFVSAKLHDVRRNQTIIEWFDGERVRKHTPDFRATLQDGRTIFIEVKSRYFLQKSSTRWKFDAIKAQTKAAGLAYILITEDHICHRIPLQLVSELNNYGSVDVVCEQSVDQVLSLLKAHSELSIAMVSNALDMSAAQARAGLMHLAANNILKVAFHKRVDTATIFSGANL